MEDGQLGITMLLALFMLLEQMQRPSVNIK